MRTLLTASTGVVLLLLTACAADAEVDAPATGAAPTGTVPATAPTTVPGAVPGSTAADGPAGDACLVGAADCADIPTGTGGPESGPDGSLPVADALAAQVQGPFLMSGLYLVDGNGSRLCEVFLESFPPQCGGASVALDESGTAVTATTTTEGDVSWSDGTVAVEGELVGDVFVVGPP